MPESPDLSVIVVNWNSADFVRKCLASVYQQKSRLSIEAIVIDNGSRDGCGEMIATEFPDASFIQTEANLGFGRANNLAFEKSNGRLLLFLNPDTEVSESAIERMAKVLDRIPDAGVVGARLLNSDLSVQTSCIQRFPTTWKVFMDSDVLRRLFPGWSLWGTRPLFDQPREAVAVDAISGACQMIRRDVFRRAGLYNTAYFMYAEDIDLCRNVMDLGLRNYYVGDAVVVHHGGQSSRGDGESGRVAVMMRESWARYFELHRGRRYAIGFRAAVALQATCRLMLIAAAWLMAGNRVRRRRLSLVKNKWNSILRWAVGLESWVGDVSAKEPCTHTS